MDIELCKKLATRATRYNQDNPKNDPYNLRARLVDSNEHLIGLLARIGSCPDHALYHLLKSAEAEIERLQFSLEYSDSKLTQCEDKLFDLESKTTEK